MSPCERCYEQPRNCTRCIACVDNELENCYVKEGSDEVLMPSSCEQMCVRGGIGPDADRLMGAEPNPELFNYCGKGNT